MHGIVSDLLELSRLEAGSSDAEMEPIDVAGMLSLMRREVLSRPDRTAQVDLQLESDALLLGAESELHSICQNLITNAVKYTPPEGAVSVRYWTDGHGSHVAVSDTGIGIPASHLPRLTERFYRVDAGRSRKLGGSGLGLAIVKHALQRHGAQLEITSEEGKGSTFTCHFPPARVQLRESPIAGVA
jgi:two-component system phosphate regulon sensor histidine kinase PhoR